MSDKYENFDEKKLFERKAHHCGYRFCPLCGGELRLAEIDGLPRMRCVDPECGFVFYQNPVPAAGAIIVENEEILLVKRAHPPRIGYWCIPAGFMEWQEHPSETAVREVEEETGLEIELDSFFEVYTGRDDPRSNAVLMLYLARAVGGRLKAGDDASDVRFFSLDQPPENLAFESHVRAIRDYNRRFRRKP
jgi:ADP-ribose pyrophosphatase YjhB (NUDIX family)